MRTFLHGWRRRAGVATLVMACVLLCAWGRSSVVRDHLRVMTIRGRQQVIYSEPGEMQWLGWKETHPPLNPTFWNAAPVTYGPKQPRSLFRFNTSIGRSQLSLMTMPTVFVRAERWVIPYWVLVLPLAVISACLLLWRPRKRPSRN